MKESLIVNWFVEIGLRTLTRKEARLKLYVFTDETIGRKGKPVFFPYKDRLSRSQRSKVVCGANRQLQKRERTGKEYGCFPFA